MSTQPHLRLSDSHIPALDGLRGVAILLVLFLHFGNGLIAPTAYVDRLFIAIARTGGMGVDLFFVLSGFLITGILYDTKQSTHYFRQFYIRRFLRIFPLYYGSLFIFLILLPAFLSNYELFQRLKEDAVWYLTYLYNFKVAYEGFNASSVLGHFWSLAAEEQFYLIWPVVVFALNRRYLIVACWICIAGALLFRIGLVQSGFVVASTVLMPAKMDALAVGGLIAVFARSPDMIHRVAHHARTALVLAGILVASMFVFGFSERTGSGTLLAAFFGALLIHILETPAGIVGQIMTSPVLRFFGRYSYALYVFHHPLFWFWPASTVSFLPPLWGSQLPGYLQSLVIEMGVCIAIALLSWHLLEKHFLRLKKVFPYDRSRGTNNAVPAGHPS